MLRPTIGFAVFLVTGIGIAIVAVPVMGIIMAVAIPAEYFAWFRAHGVPSAGLFVVNFALIFFSLGIPTAAFLVMLYRFLYPVTKVSVIAFLFGFFVTIELAIPVINGFRFADYAQLPWYAYAFHIAMISAVLPAYLVARRRRHNNSFKQTPLRDAA